MLTFWILRGLALLFGITALGLFLQRRGVVSSCRRYVNQCWKQQKRVVVVLIGAGGVLLLTTVTYPIHFALPPSMQSHAPGGMPASIPLWNAVLFLAHLGSFEHVEDIGADPRAVPPPITRTENETVSLTLVAKEVIAEVAPGISFNYWTYNGTTPGPMLRIKEGDTVELTLINDPSSLHAHNIDLHAVTGPGGGAALTNVMPGESKTFRWQALAPGIYEYHCAMANVSVHNAHGQYGLVLVEPKEGLPPVDREFYLVQGELYTQGSLGAKGLQLFDAQSVLDSNPDYVTFNGRVETVPRMYAKVGDRIRLYVGNGGINLVSSFHVIGEIFDVVYPEGSIGETVLTDVQTTIIPAGGATIVEFTVEVPGKYTLVDHALARMNKGAWAVLEVAGLDNPSVFRSVESHE